MFCVCFFFFSSRRRHTRWTGDWSSDVCSSDLPSPSSLAPAIEDGDGLLVDDPRDGRPALQDEEGPDGGAPVEIVRGLGLELMRSEERRVGKECRSRWATECEKKREDGDSGEGR